LAESVRIEGRPRQRHIAFLGSIKIGLEWNRDVDTAQRSGFWHHARAVLDRLGNRITLDQRAKIEAALAARVKPLTPEEDAELRETRERYRMMLGRMLVGA
jgi:hypothetical protein